MKGGKDLVYYVGAFTQQEVAQGALVQAVMGWANATLQEAQNALALVSSGSLRMIKELVEVYSLSGLGEILYDDEEEGEGEGTSMVASRFGNYWSYLFMNEAAQLLAERYGIYYRPVGQLDSTEMPRHLAILIKTVWFHPT